MNKDIENIIKNDELEKLKFIIKDIKGYSPDGEIGTLCEQAEQILSQINTSLIADEVLKVVVEKIKGMKQSIKYRDWNNDELKSLNDYDTAIEDLLSTLSHNKENK